LCCALQALIVDEAHRLKNTKSSTRQALQDLSVRWLLMLSGTPVQNNMKELQVSGIGLAGRLHSSMT
jgi:SNF2 family DNA or RNA helicase